MAKIQFTPFYPMLASVAESFESSPAPMELVDLSYNRGRLTVAINGAVVLSTALDCKDFALTMEQRIKP